MKRRQQDSSSDSSSSEDEKPTVPAKRAKNNAEETVEKTTDDLILHPMFDYLEKWKNDRANWKFNTNKQVCIPTNINFLRRNSSKIALMTSFSHKNTLNYF
jgi:hypothetical protein